MFKYRFLCTHPVAQLFSYFWRRERKSKTNKQHRKPQTANQTLPSTERKIPNHITGLSSSMLIVVSLRAHNLLLIFIYLLQRGRHWDEKENQSQNEVETAQRRFFVSESHVCLHVMRIHALVAQMMIGKQNCSNCRHHIAQVSLHGYLSLLQPSTLITCRYWDAQISPKMSLRIMEILLQPSYDCCLVLNQRMA